MGVKVEGVRADERVAVADSTARNRKLLIGGGIALVVVVVVVVVLMEALKPVPTYGPVGHQFQIAFGGGPTQSGAANVGGFQATTGVSGQETWRFGNSSITETVEIESIPANDPFLLYGQAATGLLEQELPGSHAVSISGLIGVEATVSGSNGGLSTTFPYTATAVLIQGNTQYIVQASGESESDVTSFVDSFKTVG